jgi:hypothetical protein
LDRLDIAHVMKRRKDNELIQIHLSMACSSSRGQYSERNILEE